MFVWSETLYIYYYFLPRFTVPCMKLVIFYFIITFSYTKYFVHSYTVDVVFTLSYDMTMKEMMQDFIALARVSEQKCNFPLRKYTFIRGKYIFMTVPTPCYCC